ncbi:MAG: Tc toxin subunit A, partial [Phormidium sp.]
MAINPELPNYEYVFGEVDLRKADDARSVYSPGAYLADLLQVLDDNFKNSDFHKENRRADIKEILIERENTYNSIPYLNIVNEVIENVLQHTVQLNSNLYEELKSAKYPFNLPFSFDNERIKKFISYLNVTAEQIYKVFILEVDPGILAREYLGLSLEEYNLLITQIVPEEEAEILRQYNIQSFDNLNNLENFLKITSISSQDFKELIYQFCSENAKSKTNNSRTEKLSCADLFINYNLNGYAKLDKNEENIEWQELEGSKTTIPISWYERVNRFIRLAKKIQLSFTDLDIILRSCCNNKLDAELDAELNAKAIKNIAVVKQIHDLYELPIDVVCSFFSDINILGIGSENEPKDLFNRIFNSAFADFDKKYISVSEFTPEKYSGYTQLNCSGDLLSLNNKEYRVRLNKALNISDKDLTHIVNKFRDRAKFSESKGSILASDKNVGLSALSLLFRVSKLTEVLDISYDDLFNLLDILEKDSSIRTYNNFNILIANHTQEQDCYKIIEGSSSLQDSIWLVQVLFAITNWMRYYNFTSEEVKQIVIGGYKNEIEEESSREQKINFLNTLYQDFKSVILDADFFQSDLFDSRSARAIHFILTGEDSKVISQKDRRLLTYEQRFVEQLA